ncbi:uncharacterized protein LOC135487305 isoform X2 [Lineus longissimus]
MFRDFAPQVVPADSNSENGSENNSVFGGRHDGFSAGIDFNDPLKRGNVFSSVMNNNSSHSNWTDYMPQYNPFGTSTVLQELEKNRPGPKPKRSYSDVAKNRPKSTNGQEEHEGREKRSSSLSEDLTLPVGPSGFKGKKKAPVKSRGFTSKRGQSKDNLCSNILPDAKYGLDSFDEPVSGGDREGSERSDSTDNLSETGKTSSTASGIDEIHLSTNINAYGGSGSVRIAGSRYDPVLGDIDVEPEVVHNDERKPETKAFFDPKRIFAPRPNNAPTKKSTKNSIPNNRDNSKSTYSNDEEFILNNGKCRSNFNSSTAPKTASYINNDLRDRSEPRKQTNTEAKLNHDRVNSSSGNHADGSANCRVNKQKSHEGQERVNHGESQRAAKQKKVQMGLGIGRLLEMMYLWMKWCAKDVVAAMFLYVVAVTWRVVTLLTSIVKFYTVSVCSSTYSWIKNRLQSLFPQRYKTGRTWSGMPSYQQQSYGLEENIPLPSTGDEAMKRLLSCSRGKDPYSILGLRSDCSDDDIKRYYRKQAVLVHPDKNSQPGAEEAFKILGHAFELIGKPEKRLTYDQQCKETRAAEEAMQEFADLLTKLQEKMQEAANMMRCDHCGGKHRRIPVDRPCYSARQCDRCNTRHSAKEGDVWAESLMLGFLWYYYACMDNKIYDITEWAACRQGDYFKHMLANSHHVIYRMAVNSNRHQHHHQGRQGQGGNDGDLEDFINHLFTKSMQNDQKDGFSGSQQPSRPAWNSANKTNKKRGKKKKH